MSVFEVIHRWERSHALPKVLPLEKIDIACICGGDHAHAYWDDDGRHWRCCLCGTRVPV